MNKETLDIEKEKEKKIELSDETKVKLEGMGFLQKADKLGLYVKDIDDETQFYWDFRKTPKGTAYSTKDEEFVKDDIVKQMQEYVVIRGLKKEKPSKSKAMVPASDKKAVGLLRGSERDIIRLMDHKIQLDSIIDASKNKNKLGEGLLWHELKFGDRIHVEPSAELIDMLTLDMGQITTEIVEFDTNVIEDPATNKKYATYYCVVKATDGISGTSGLGVAEQVIDFKELNNANNPRTFARTNAVRKAERNAKERLLPIPRKALVSLIIKKLEEHNKSKDASSKGK